ncbi:MAG: anhydro-N-acetylmuramic acid kinase [Gallionella sp.]|nr:anhydro-N-acetylmuramic acid kinase [Gallionella sp.]
MPANAQLYVGLMSGTSLDGVDAVLVDLQTEVPRLITRHFIPFDTTLQNTLLALHLPAIGELHAAQVAGIQLAHLYAEAVLVLLQSSGVAAQQVRAIGCHGQTVRHRPELGYTLQLGNSPLLAELTGICVVSDFRNRDIAAGGQGAPLVPAFHDRVLRHTHEHRVIANIGGISNLTNLPPGGTTTGFDCGTGNLLMDAWCARHTGRAFDEGGAWAASGNVLTTLLAAMLAENFFSLEPPKSSGRDLFNMDWLESKLGGDETPQDVQATLLELTALGIAHAVTDYCPGATALYLCGGGAHNTALHLRITALLPHCRVSTTDDLGMNGDYLEAIAFAWLAQQTLHGNPANLPAVTGAHGPRVLGAIYPA